METLKRCTHDHITPYLAERVDQMRVVIVLHLPQRSSHAGHEAPLHKREKSAFNKQSGSNRRLLIERLCACESDLYQVADLIRSEFWGRLSLPRFARVGALTLWAISLTCCPPLLWSLSLLIIMPARPQKCCLYCPEHHPGSVEHCVTVLPRRDKVKPMCGWLCEKANASATVLGDSFDVNGQSYILRGKK